MKKIFLRSGLTGILLTSLVVSSSQALVSKKAETFTASAVVGDSSTSPSLPPTLTIRALPLEEQVFGGKNFAIPVEVVNLNGVAINPSGMRADVVYQLIDPTGNLLTSPTPASITFQKDPDNPARLLGTAYIPRNLLRGVSNGGRIDYYFSVLQGGAGIYKGEGTGAGVKPFPSGGSAADAIAAAMQDAYGAQVVNEFEFPVTPAGSIARAPDTFQTDGGTGLILDPGAVSAPGTVRIQRVDESHVAAGPNGAQALAAYDFSLLNTTLQKPAQLVLSYSADLNGKISDSNGNPTDLAPYWYDGFRWRLLSRAKVDTVLHTVSGTLPPGELSQKASFALFTIPGGAGAAAVAQRPPQKIITPNGDGTNDAAIFSGLSAGEEVKIFDLRGRRVRSVQGPPHEWDGRDDNGETVESGVYLYQFTSGGERVSGVIAVAK